MRSNCNRGWNGSDGVAPATLRNMAICAIAIGLATSAAFAQKAGAPPSGGRSAPAPPVASPAPPMPTGANTSNSSNQYSYPSMDTARFDILPSMAFPPVDNSAMIGAESCNTWTEAGVFSPTVSATRLEIPGKASGEYQKGCGAFKDRKLQDAEKHLRKAIEMYSNYAAAWVVLGQVLDAQNKRDDARSACSHARDVDPHYMPPYLCLADFAASEQDWAQVAALSERAIVLQPVNNAYALYYTATAAFHLQNLHRAERLALDAVTLDTWHHLPQAHLLLAQIYQAGGDIRAQVAQLREYLKAAPSSPDSAAAKNTLAELESQPAK